MTLIYLKGNATIAKLCTKADGNSIVYYVVVVLSIVFLARKMRFACKALIRHVRLTFFSDLVSANNCVKIAFV